MGDDALMLSLAALINMIVLDRKMKMYRRFVPKSGVQVILVFAISCVATTSDAAELNYNIAPKQVVPYKVNIVATTTSSRDTMTGTIAFTGKQSSDEQFTVGYVGSLSRRTTQSRSTGRAGRGGFGGFRGPGGPSIPGFMGRGVSMGGLTRMTNEVVVGRRGEIRKLTGQSQLPYLIGNLSILPFEALPKGDQKAWKVGTGISITEEEDSPFFGGPFRGNKTVTTGGSESATYKIQKDDGKLVTIATTYRLVSPAAKKNGQAIEIKGTGTFIFNRELGVPESHEMKRTVTVTENGSTVTTPMTIAYHRIPVEDYQTQQKARQDMIAKAQKAHAERSAKANAAAKAAEGKKLDPEKKKQILAELNSSKWPTIAQRLRSMSRFVPHPDDFDVAMRVKELQTHNVLSVYRVARELWLKLDPIVEAGKKEMTTATTAGDDPFATADEKKSNEGRGLREWTSGEFKVEAEFVRFDGTKIVLKRKDGKELSVPINLLSPADQKIAEALKKPAKPKNPFE